MLAELQLNYDKLVVHCVCCRSLRTLERFMLCAVSRERLKTGSSCWKQKFLSMSETYIVCNKCRICLCMLMAVLLFLCTCLDGHIGTAAVEWASVNIVHSVIWIVFIVFLSNLVWMVIGIISCSALITCQISCIYPQNLKICHRVASGKKMLKEVRMEWQWLSYLTSCHTIVITLD